ncbi:MAG: YihY/virulence factor BrkB family protein [Deltaproteobacteria bacterium]
MTPLVRRINNFFERDIWSVDTKLEGGRRAFTINTLRLVYVSLHEFRDRELTLRAMSLVYTTLLSLVPLLAFSFSILKAFGVHNELEPLLYNFLAPLGEQGVEITGKILEFVENMKVGVLGSIGLGMLLYTVVELIYKMEKSLNHIWKIQRMRSIARRFSDYISTLLIGPALLFSAIGLTATVKSNTVVVKLLAIEPFGSLIYFLSKLGPYIFISLAFTFVYVVIPNTKVKIRSALLGGVVAGVLWQTIGWGFASFVASSTRYTAIYSGFAVLVVFMLWLYLSWLILLIGAQISFCHQNLKFLTLNKESFSLSHRLREKVSLMVMYLIGYNHHHNLPRWTLHSLVDYLGIPEEPVETSVSRLEARGLIAETGDDPPSYLPAKDIDTIGLKEVLDSARVGGGGHNLMEGRLASVPEVDEIMQRADDSLIAALGEESIKTLVLRSGRGI